MSELSQQFDIIHPHDNSSSPHQTLVYVVNHMNTSTNIVENFYFLLSIWAPVSDISQIFDHTTQIFVDQFYNDSNTDFIEDRFKRAHHAANTAFAQLSTYYHKNDQRFHIEGLIVFVLSDVIYVSSAGDAQIYLSRDAHTKTLIDKNAQISDASLFRKPAFFKLHSKDQLLLVSNRFFDHIPKAILYNYLQKPQTDSSDSYTQFKKSIQSLHSPHLAGIQLNLATIAKQDILEVAEPKAKNKKKSTHRAGNWAKNALHWCNNNIIIPISKALKSYWTNLWSKYINPNPLIPLALLGVLVVAILGTIGYFVIYNPHSQALKKSYQQYTQEISQAKQLSATDKSSATSLLHKLEREIANLNKEDKTTINSMASKQKTSTLDELLNQISAIQDTLKSITRVNATTIYTGAELAEFGSIVQLGNLLYTIDTNSGDIISVNITTSVPKTVATSPELRSAIALSVGQNDTLYALTKNGIYSIKTNGVVAKQNNSSGDWPVGQNIATYGSSLYLLSPTDNQIYRYTKLSNGFGPKSSYTKGLEANTLSDSTSLAINGNVFVGTKSGNILHFNQGIQREFTVSDAPSDLQDITQLTYSDTPEELLALNSTRSAIIILALEESGARYQKELVVNGTSQVTSFVFDKKSKSVFFTSNNTLQKITIP